MERGGKNKPHTEGMKTSTICLFTTNWDDPPSKQQNSLVHEGILTLSMGVSPVVTFQICRHFPLNIQSMIGKIPVYLVTVRQLRK